MRVLLASSEVYPYSKTGGLGDVLGSLPAALAALGHEVLVVTPWYKTLREGAPLWIGDVEIPFDDGFSNVGVGTLERDGVRLAFVGHDDFSRDSIYGYPDDVRRFCRFTRSVPAVAARVGFEPDVVHVNDWHTAYLPLVLERGWHLPPGFAALPTVLTIHNAQYQGVSAAEETLRWLRLPPELRDGPVVHLGSANALHAGISYAQRITTVSPTYARELLTTQFAYSLENALESRRHDLVGILNGIETSVWNPATDPLLPRQYGPEDLSGKAASKRTLCERYGLGSDPPLLGAVTRLAEQKGIDVLLRAAPELQMQGWALFLLGSGEPQVEELVRRLRDEGVIAAEIGYDEELAHLVYAGADALAIPSRFEPCGLSQLISMRYGTLPIARATGGLVDTIEAGVTGYLFDELSEGAILGATSRALQDYGTSKWTEMMREAMSRDFSWQRSARSYEGLYEQIRRRS